MKVELVKCGDIFRIYTDYYGEFEIEKQKGQTENEFKSIALKQFNKFVARCRKMKKGKPPKIIKTAYI